MKAERQHRVPLSDRAASILRALPRDGDHVFNLSHIGMRPADEIKDIKPVLTMVGGKIVYDANRK
jgi:hypothetical protein